MGKSCKTRHVFSRIGLAHLKFFKSLTGRAQLNKMLDHFSFAESSEKVLIYLG